MSFSLKSLLTGSKSKRLTDWASLEASDGFCTLPWVHLYVSTQGKVTPCCISPWEEELVMGDLNKQPLDAIWNGKPMEELRSKMLRGEKDQRCWQCHENESLGLRSKRQTSNYLYEHRFDWIKETSNSGKVKNAKPIYWDIRISNLCNFKCRICNHHSSSKLFEEAKVLGTAAFPEAVHYSLEDFTGFMRDLEPAFEEVEEIYFAGGEPLIMEQHYHILEKLIKQGRRDVKLRYATNFSITRFKQWDVFELWKNFDTVFIHASLDGSHARGEFQRAGQRWSKVVEERERLRETAPHVNFMISPTVSIFNIMHLPDFHHEWVEKGLVVVDDLIPHTLKSPAEYNIQVLSKQMKEKVAATYQRHVEWLHTFENQGLEKLHIVIKEFESIIHYMNAEDRSELLNDFREKTAQLDAMRGENTTDSLPELREILD